MKQTIFIITFLFGCLSQAQYYPRGTNLNDNYLPNLDQPDKWMIALDGMLDWQKEESQGTNTTYELTRANFNLFYGGQEFRGGVQVIHDFNRDVKDLSVGFGLGINRPLFLEAGVGYLNRILNTTSYDGWSYSAKAGYYFNWVMQMKYRIRIRVSFMVNYKKIHSAPEQSVLQFHPLLGLEFET